jgi:hypothetical protein
MLLEKPYGAFWDGLRKETGPVGCTWPAPTMLGVL